MSPFLSMPAKRDDVFEGLGCKQFANDLASCCVAKPIFRALPAVAGGRWAGVATPAHKKPCFP